MMHLARISDILDAVGDVKVLVVGDLMLDRYVHGEATHISPEAPVPVVLEDHRTANLGGAGNVAANVVALGARCTIVGVVGGDEAGYQVMQCLTDIGCGQSAIVRVGGRPTTTKTRVMSGIQQVARYDLEDTTAYGSETAEALTFNLRHHLRTRGFDVLIVQDYDKGVMCGDVIRTVKDAACQGLCVVVDPKEHNFWNYGGVRVFKPNERELTAAVKERVRPDDENWLEGVRHRGRWGNLLLTLGSSGMVMASGDGHHHRIDACRKHVADVSCAGDTVIACMGVLLAAGASNKEAALISNLAASLEVAKPGCQVVRIDEIRAHYGLRVH